MVYFHAYIIENTSNFDHIKIDISDSILFETTVKQVPSPTFYEWSVLQINRNWL